MTTWVKENCLTLFQIFCIKVVNTGRVPQHVAFIMDGNRRFAQKYKRDSVVGHQKGFDKLSETVKEVQRTLRSTYNFIIFRYGRQWCLVLGIPEVTVYAFSIENFKRKTNEVNALMDLSRDKFERLLNEIEAINKLGIRVHVVGRLSLLPEDLHRLVCKVMLATRNNKKLRLNVAFAYTGRDEIIRAASHLIDCVEKNELSAEAIDENMISQSLDIGEPELLIRTSGEIRLSDFMLWQVPNTVLYFTDVLWPELTIWTLLRAIIHFQRNAPSKLPVKENIEIQQQFLDKLERKRWKEMEKMFDHIR